MYSDCMSDRTSPTGDAQFRFKQFVATHGARLLVALVVLGALAVGGAAGEGSELLVEPQDGGERGDNGP